MTQAYQLLYDIETTLRQIISHHMNISYGRAWEHRVYEKHPFTSCYFHELIPYFVKYPPLQEIFTTDERRQLYQLTPIRNKICHMKLLDQQEYALLERCHLLIKRIVKEKTKGKKMATI
jgi:hypothetical protein